MRTVVRPNIYLSDVASIFIGFIMKVEPVWLDRKNYNVVSVSALKTQLLFDVFKKKTPCLRFFFFKYNESTRCTSQVLSQTALGAEGIPVKTKVNKTAC